MKIRVTILYSITYFLFVSVQSQTLRRPVAASYLGMGAYSYHHADAFSFTANQAALATIKNFSAGVYGEKRFMLNELNNFTAVLAIPSKSGNFGLKTNYFGFQDYNESELALAYGRSLGSKLDIGASFNYHGIRITGYGNEAALGIELGTILHLTDKLQAGLHISNPVGGRFEKEQDEKLAAVYSVGLGYDASEKFYIGLEMEKEEDRPVNINAGLQYQFITRLLARVGISSATATVWAGLGITIHSLRIDITSSYHPVLGITPGLLLVYSLTKP